MVKVKIIKNSIYNDIREYIGNVYEAFIDNNSFEKGYCVNFLDKILFVPKECCERVNEGVNKTEKYEYTATPNEKTEQELRTSEQARIYQKLGKLEDILEKYGIESVEELDNKLADGITWQKACELACDILMPKSEIKTIQLNDDNQIINSKEAIDYFYQQAKQFAGR